MRLFREGSSLLHIRRPHMTDPPREMNARIVGRMEKLSWPAASAVRRVPKVRVPVCSLQFALNQSGQLVHAGRAFAHVLLRHSEHATVHQRLK